MNNIEKLAEQISNSMPEKEDGTFYMFNRYELDAFAKAYANNQEMYLLKVIADIRQAIGDTGKLMLDELATAIAKELQSSEPVALTVWENAMPESNGKSNFTAILMRKGGELHEGMTIARSEYPDRVRYEAEHDALVADAERYRWLCENKQVPWGLFIKNAHELGIDQAIDSAKGK